MENGGVRLLFLSDHLGHAGGVVHGATTYFLNVLPRLREEGVKVTACFLRGRHPVAEKLEAAGVEPIFLNRGKWDFRVFADLCRLIRTRRIQVVHAAGMKGILLGRAAAHMSRKPAIIHLHDLFAPDPLMKALHRSMAGWTDLCLAISKATGEVAHNEFAIPRDRIRILYNGLAAPAGAAPGARERIRRELDLPASAAAIGIVGRLSPEKGQLPFLEALPRLHRSHPRVRVLLVGDGPMRKSCEDVTRRLGLTQIVRFAGFRDDIPDVLAAVDIVAIPSLSEGFSYSAVEAMLAGRPIVAFGVGGIPEVISDGKGLLATPGDMEGFLNALRRLLDEDDLGHRLLAQARAHAKKFSIERHVEELLTHYRSLCNEWKWGPVRDVATDTQ